MFDLAWSEIALIAVVALVVIGPKDLPEAVRGAARGMQKLRRMLGQFQTQADELVREAKLDEVRNQIHEVRNAVSEFRNFDLKGEVERSIDPDGSLKRGMSDPMSGASWQPPAPTEPASGLEAQPGAEPAAQPASVPPDPAPAFIPPGTTPPITAAPSAQA